MAGNNGHAPTVAEAFSDAADLRTPHSSKENEQWALGGALMIEDAKGAVFEIASPADFRSYAKLARVLQTLPVGGDRLPDLVLLTDKLIAAGIPEAEAAEQVQALARGTLMTLEATLDAARVVTDKARLRSYTSNIREIFLEASRPDARVEDLIELHARLGECLSQSGQPPAVISARDLVALELPDLAYVVRDIIPMGLTVLAGKPKLGKSWLTLGIGAAVASGGMALGAIHVAAAEVLMLTLEDTTRRLKSRLAKVLDGDSGDVLGMAGPGKEIAAVCACTVIRQGDLADNILDQKKHPRWQGERTKLIDQLPADWLDSKGDRLWHRYGEIRDDARRRSTSPERRPT